MGIQHKPFSSSILHVIHVFLQSSRGRQCRKNDVGSDDVAAGAAKRGELEAEVPAVGEGCGAAGDRPDVTRARKSGEEGTPVVGIARRSNRPDGVGEGIVFGEAVDGDDEVVEEIPALLCGKRGYD